MILDRKTYTGLALTLVGLAALIYSCSGGSSPTNNNEAQTGVNSGGNSATTSAFGIPDGITGTVSDGETLYGNNCAMCHGQSLGPKTFDQIKAALASISAMRSLSLTDQEIANITMYLNRNNLPPQTSPPPAGDPGGGTNPPPPTDPGTTPTDTTTGYGIPTGLSGSISAGETIWSGTCTMCHNSMSPKTYQQIQSALANVGQMRALNLTEQQIADITAFLNRAAIQGQPGTTVGSGDDDEDDDSSMDDDDEGEDDGSGGDDSLDDDSDDGSSGGNDDGMDDGSDDGSSDGSDDSIDDDGGDDSSSGSVGDDDDGNDDGSSGGEDDDEGDDD